MLVFVEEDPGKKLSTRERELRDSVVKSHLGSRKHYLKRRNARIAHNDSESRRLLLCRHRVPDDTITTSHTRRADPEHQVYEACSELAFPPRSLISTMPDETFKEGRSMQFFIEKTAVERSTWYSSHFWQVLVIQASVLHSCIRHCLVSLAAVHEALEMPTEFGKIEQMAWARQNANRALLRLSRDYSGMSLSSLLLAHILVDAYTGLLYFPARVDAMRIAYNLDEQLWRRMAQAPHVLPETDKFDIINYLHPIIERQRSMHGQVVDLNWCLRTTEASHFDVADRPNVPTRLISVEHARSTLDQLLNWTVFTVKTKGLPPNVIPAEADAQMTIWLSALDDLQKSYELSDQDLGSNTKHNIYDSEVVRLSANVFFMMIKTMNSKSEIVFDQYVKLYEDIVIAFKAILAYTKSVCRLNFSMFTEASLLAFVANAACRWCRDPSIRKELIELLYESRRRQAVEGAVVWPEIARHLQAIEESNIIPPPLTASDIPESARVRFDGASFYQASGVFSIRYVRYPFRQHVDTSTIYVARPSYGSHFHLLPEVPELKESPDVIIGRGNCSWLVQASTSTYFTVKEPKFYFNIPVF